MGIVLKTHRNGLLAVLLFLGYLGIGIYSLESGQHAIVLRFGKHIHTEVEPGIHYHLPFPIETIRTGDVNNVQALYVQGTDTPGELKYTYDEHYIDDQYITGDENLIMIRATINYDIKDLTGYLFGVDNITAVLRSAGQECISREISRISVDDVMTAGKSQLRLVLKSEIQALLDLLGTGINVLSVELTDIVPPRDISDVFKAVSDARVEKEGIIRNAEGYANSVIPEARGKAARTIASAEAEADEILKESRGKVDAFLALLAEYEKHPQVIKKQQYLQTLNKIGLNSKIIIDSNPSQSTYYVP